MPREPRPDGVSRTTFWAAGAAAVVGAATLLARRLHVAPVRAAVGARYDGASARGRAKEPASATAREAGHETSDMRGGLMAKLFLLLGSVAFCTVFAMIGLHFWLSQVQRNNEPSLTRVQTTAIVPPKPNLQRAPVAELNALRSRSTQQLDGYGYRENDPARAHIPIDRAMALSVGQPLAPPP